MTEIKIRGWTDNVDRIGNGDRLASYRKQEFSQQFQIYPHLDTQHMYKPIF